MDFFNPGKEETLPRFAQTDQKAQLKQQVPGNLKRPGSRPAED